jgi:hypothetical protein
MFLFCPGFDSRAAGFSYGNEFSFAVLYPRVHDYSVKIENDLGGYRDMADETAEQKLARLEAENRTLRDQVEQRKPGQLRLKVSEKGALSVYGLGRFPVTLYKEQWNRLLDYTDEIKSFLKENDHLLKAKQ